MKRDKLRQFELENGLFEGIKALLLYYLVNQGVAILGLSAIKAWAESGQINSEYLLYPETAVKMAAMFLGALSVFSYYKKENEYEKLRRTISGESKLSFGMVVLIVGAGAAISLVLNYLFSILGFMQSSESYRQVAGKQFALPLWLAFLFYGILSPWAEEVVFRGIFYRGLKRSMAEVAAVLGSAFAFGAFHGNLVQMVYGTIMGIIIALVYRKFHNLLAPVLFHGAANVAVYVVSFYFSF